MVACFAPHLASAFVLMALLALTCRSAGFGLCKRCEERREPRCKCPGGNPDEPQVRRIRWKDPRK